MCLMVTDEDVAQARQHVLLQCGRRGPGAAGAVFREPPNAIRVATARLVDEGLVKALDYEVGGVRKLGVRLTDLGLQRLKP